MTFKVTYEDGSSVDAVAKTRDIVEFERKYKASFLAFGNGSPMEWLFFLAWSPLNRSNREPRSFEAFLDEVASIEPQDDDAPVPSQAGPSGDSSPGSPSTSE